MMIKYKLREVATDLGVTNKEVIEVLSKYIGGEPKSRQQYLQKKSLT